MSMSSGDMNWPAPTDPSTTAGGGGRMFINEDDFIDDFDDDDDAFFSSATVAAVAGGASDDANVPMDAVNKSAPQSTVSSFGMLALTYENDVKNLSSGSARGPTSPTSDSNNLNNAGGLNGLDGEDDITDDEELLEFDRKYLVHLRNPNSSYRDIARSCLALYQHAYSSGNESSSTTTTSTTFSSQQCPITIKSSCIYHIQRYQSLIHRILSSLTTCLTTHDSSPCKSLASKTLATIARSSYARLKFDARLTSVRLPPSIATRLEDECGNGTAHTLIVAAIEQGDDTVSSSALEALGILTLDTHTDSLAAEVRGIASCANTNVFMYETADSKKCWILEHSLIMKEMSFKIWEHVIFPRMQNVLHRLSLYDSAQHLARSIPVVTAAFVHALTQGHDTHPSRRAIQSNKASHGKRGWREVDAEGLAKEYVEGILLPLLDAGGSNKFHGDKALQHALAGACMRMSSALPNAPWRVSACRHAVIVLMQQLNKETNSDQSSSVRQAGKFASTKLEMINLKGKKSSSSLSISSTLAQPSVPVETLAGTAAMLVIALRGIPLHERAPGLAAVLRATLMFLPLGVSISSKGGGSLDLTIAKSGGDGQTTKSYRLGRTGLLTEVALSIMLDGVSNRSQQGETISGTRAVLLQHVLQSDQLAIIWEMSRTYKDSPNHPMDELIWTLCSVANQVGKMRKEFFEKDNASAMEWCNISLVILDFFGAHICNPSHCSQWSFTNASLGAYNCLFAAVAKQCGSCPPSSISIMEKMLPNTSSEEKNSPVVGGPGKKHHHVASSALSRVATRLLNVRDKPKHSSSSSTKKRGASIEISMHIAQVAALLVDTWLGQCIMNHDAKQSNQGQLDVALMFLPMCRSEVEFLLQKHNEFGSVDKILLIAQLCRVHIASLEHVTCMSELLMKGTADSDMQVCRSAIAILNGIIAFAKEGVATDSKEGSMLRYQVAYDANHAISRIVEFSNNRPQSQPDDIVSSFQVSPLIENVNLTNELSATAHRTIEHPTLFLYNHARLVCKHRTYTAVNAVAPTSSSVGGFASTKLIHPRNALRISNSFAHSTIDMYQKVGDLPLLIPARLPPEGNTRPMTLTGSSDPVSLIMSHSVRRVRNNDYAEDSVVVITLRLYNITPVPIVNGVRLDLKIAQKFINTKFESSAPVATIEYNHEIKTNDFITWEVTLGTWDVGSITLQASITFKEVAQESSTHKWVSSGGDQALPSETLDDDDESVSDITLPCRPVKIYPMANLVPCPLVFFGGITRCQSNVGRGDAASFEYLWDSMEQNQVRLPFVIPNDQLEGKPPRTLAGTQKGYVTLSLETKGEGETDSPSDPVTGCAFIASNGYRILCVDKTKDDSTRELQVRSDSSNLLASILGDQSSKASFLKFLFGVNAQRSGGSDQSVPEGKKSTGHDFPSMTMKPNVGHDFPSITMPHQRPILS